MRTFALLMCLLACAACSKNKSAAGNPKSAPAYSTTACSDNCGRDAQCISTCQPVSNQNPLPMGTQPLK